MSSKKVTIIGAGPGGLTAGMILSKRGFDVHLYEKSDRVGGRNAMINLGDFRFDTGPTFLMLTFILKEVFQLAGRNINDYLTITPLDPMYRLRFGEKDVLVSSNHEKMLEEVAKKFPGQEEGLKRFYVREKQRFENLFPCLQKEYRSLFTYLHTDFIKALPHLDFGKSVYDILSGYFSEELLKLTFTFQSKYLGMSAWECPALFTLIPYIEHHYGIDHVKGGLNQISEQMAKVIRENGGTIHLNTTVKELDILNGQAKGLILQDGQRVSSDFVVINSDFAHSMNHLVHKKHLKKYPPEKVNRMRYSCSTFMLYLGVDKLYDIPHHNVFFANNYKQNIDDIFTNKKLTKPDMSFYIQNASITDDTLAPKGQSTIYVLVPAANNQSNIDWNAIKQSYRDEVIAQIEKRTELTDLSKHIVQEKIITPDDWEHQYNVHFGATFNLSHNLTQMLTFRPHNQFEDIQNCYIVGGGTHPGSGLPTIYESGRISANSICKEVGIGVEPAKTLRQLEAL